VDVESKKAKKRVRHLFSEEKVPDPFGTRTLPCAIVRGVAAETMKNTNALIFHIIQELHKDSRPTCLPCLGITIPEDWLPVHTHVSSQYKQLLSFEDGLCWKCKTQQSTIRPLTAK
jgi:hypothetical protein